jgi:hypothetical protein
VVGSSCSWQFSFRQTVKGALGIKALHCELEQIGGTYALRESGEAYSGQFNPPRIEEVHVPEDLYKLFMNDPWFLLNRELPGNV